MDVSSMIYRKMHQTRSVQSNSSKRERFFAVLKIYRRRKISCRTIYKTQKLQNPHSPVALTTFTKYGSQHRFSIAHGNWIGLTHNSFQAKMICKTQHSILSIIKEDFHMVRILCVKLYQNFKFCIMIICYCIFNFVDARSFYLF